LREYAFAVWAWRERDKRELERGLYFAWRAAELSKRKILPTFKALLDVERGTVAVSGTAAAEQSADLLDMADEAGMPVYGG